MFLFPKKAAKKIPKCISAMFAVLIICSCFCCVNVSALSAEDITAPSAVLMEPYTKQILFEKNPHEVRACASITKVMTLILIFEAIEAGKIDYTDEVCTSAHAAGMGGSDIWLEEGEVMSVYDMIKAVVVASANDAAVALAELVCGSEDEFVNKMNERAKELGMNDTTFKNCNGLDEEGHLTCAYDVALMSAELIRHEKIFEFSSIWLDYLRDGETQIVNTNKMMLQSSSYYRSYIKGLKTGTTSQAGSCMSATAERDGLSLVAVVLGCDSGTSRFSDSAKLLDFGFANYKVATLTLPEGCLAPVDVKGGMVPFVTVECTAKESLVLPKGNAAELLVEYSIDEEIEAPVVKGQIVGKVTYSYNGEIVEECDITASQSTEAMNFGAIMMLLWQKLISL